MALRFLQSEQYFKGWFDGHRLFSVAFARCCGDDPLATVAEVINAEDSLQEFAGSAEFAASAESDKCQTGSAFATTCTVTGMFGNDKSFPDLQAVEGFSKSGQD